MKHATLRDKIKNIVKDEKDLDKVMNYIYWEVSNLQGITYQATENKVKLLLKHLAKDR